MQQQQHAVIQHIATVASITYARQILHITTNTNTNTNIRTKTNTNTQTNANMTTPNSKKPGHNPSGVVATTSTGRSQHHLVNGRSSSQMHKSRQYQTNHHQSQQNQFNKSASSVRGTSRGASGAGASVGAIHFQKNQQHLSYNHINAPNQINHMGVASQQQQQHRNAIYHNNAGSSTNQGAAAGAPPPPQHHLPQVHHHGQQLIQAGLLPTPAQQTVVHSHPNAHPHPHLHPGKNPHKKLTTPATLPHTAPPYSQQTNYQPNRPHQKANKQQHGQFNSNSYTRSTPKAILQNTNLNRNSRSSSSNNANPAITPSSSKLASDLSANSQQNDENSHSLVNDLNNGNVAIAGSGADSGCGQNNACVDQGGGGGGGSVGGGGGGGGVGGSVPLFNGNEPTIDINDDKENNPLGINLNSDDDLKTSTENINNNHNNNNNNILTLNNNNNNNILSNEDTTTSKNSKDKTPMCLVNELARYNKITHQYRLTNEKGPAHSKRFTVTLKLGDEEYTAEGFKIKKAQHLAAAEAIEKTKYKHPVPKVNRRNVDGFGRSNITPTVELNALAMKLGQQTYYVFDPRQTAPLEPLHPKPENVPPFVQHNTHMMPHPAGPHQMMDPIFLRRNPGPGNPFVGGPNVPVPQHRYMANGNQRNVFNQKYPPRFPVMPMGHLHPPGPAGVPMHHTHYPSTNCKITLIVGKQRFVGIGRNLQHAKHDAASRALQVLRSQVPDETKNDMNQSVDDADDKSPISLVHEIALKRNMTVHFKVLRDEGPAHMKNFITACIVGNIVTEGEGNGKKNSKKRAAEKMLEELKKLPPMSPSKSPVRRVKVKTPAKGGTPGGKGFNRKRANAPSIKDKSLNDSEIESPITKLIQLMQTRKAKEPVFEIISKTGNEKARRRDFIVEVTAQGLVARGNGTSKKVAKRNAAANMLTLLEQKDKENEVEDNAEEFNASMNINNVSSSSANPSTSGISEMSDMSSTNPLLTDIEVPVITTTAGQVEGILLVGQNRKAYAKKKEPKNSNNLPQEASSGIVTDGHDVPNSAKEFNSYPAMQGEMNVEQIKTEMGNESPSHESTHSSTPSENSLGKANGVNQKDQLLYLAKLLGFDVNFSNYPKGNHGDFLTIVTLSTDPPQICHGVGADSVHSENDAAKNALKILSELGLNVAK